MSVTTLIIGDCHFKTNNVLQTNAMASVILGVAKTRKPDFIVMLGDTLDRHESVHTNPLLRATTFLYELSQIAPTYLLIGNHDRPNNSDFLSDEHPFVGLKYWPNLVVVDKVKHATYNGMDFLFVPYVPPGRFEEALRTYSQFQYGKAKCIFAHQEFKGAKMGAIVSQQGDIWPSSYPFVFSGHIHDYDELQTNLIYTGTPVQHAFGDTEDKTISWATFTHTSATPNHERIDLGLPRKRILRWSCTEFLNSCRQGPPVNTELKLILRGTSSEIKALLKHPQIETWTKAGVKIAYKEVTSENDTSFVSSDHKGSGPSYYERLMSTAESEPGLVKMLLELFGPVPFKISPIPDV